MSVCQKYRMRPNSRRLQRRLRNNSEWIQHVWSSRLLSRTMEVLRSPSLSLVRYTIVLYHTTSSNVIFSLQAVAPKHWHQRLWLKSSWKWSRPRPAHSRTASKTCCRYRSTRALCVANLMQWRVNVAKCFKHRMWHLVQIKIALICTIVSTTYYYLLLYMYY